MLAQRLVPSSVLTPASPTVCLCCKSEAPFVREPSPFLCCVLCTRPGLQEALEATGAVSLPEWLCPGQARCPSRPGPRLRGGADRPAFLSEMLQRRPEAPGQGWRLSTPLEAPGPCLPQLPLDREVRRGAASSKRSSAVQTPPPGVLATPRPWAASRPQGEPLPARTAASRPVARVTVSVRKCLSVTDPYRRTKLTHRRARSQREAPRLSPSAGDGDERVTPGSRGTAVPFGACGATRCHGNGRVGRWREVLDQPAGPGVCERVGRDAPPASRPCRHGHRCHRHGHCCHRRHRCRRPQTPVGLREPPQRRSVSGGPG